MLLRYIFLLATSFIGLSAQKLPSFVTERCSLSDPSSKVCLTSAAQKSLKYMAEGFPEFSIPSIDPLKCGDIIVEQPSLKFSIKNVYLNGIKNCKINELRIDPVKKKIYLDFTKNGSMNALYTVDGQVLIIPIIGKGDAIIDFVNLHYQFKIDYDTYKGDDGRDYWKILTHTLTYSTENAKFSFSHLFNDNKLIADTTHRVLNENWKIIINDLSPPIMKEVAKSLLNILRKFFEKIPVDELFLP